MRSRIRRRLEPHSDRRARRDWALQLLWLVTAVALVALALLGKVPWSFVLWPVALLGLTCLLAVVSWIASQGQRTQVKQFIEQELEAIQLAPP